ncbi:hypothetical protein [Streptomyces sp. BE230]|nr:hypothetical protein [Streptomyces sp. BE230]
MSADEIQAMSERAFGSSRVVAAEELGGGMYNSTYRLTVEE